MNQRKPRRNPAIPGTPSDRTGSSGLLRRALAEIGRRWDGLQRDVLAVFDGIRSYQVNDGEELARTIYGLTPEEMAATSQALRDALDRWVASGREPAHTMWWSPFDAEAAHLGTAQAVANLTNLSETYAAARNLAQVVYSEAYRNRVAMAQIKSYDHWTGLAAEVRADLSQIIGRAVVDGKNQKAVRTEIANRLGVSKSRAEGYAQTDITDTLRQARWAENDYATETLGLNLGLLWTSALLPTTRPTHAARNGKVYTTQEVRDFYSKDGNRYRCHCSQTDCLLDEDDKPILSDALKKTMREQREAWEGENLNT